MYERHLGAPGYDREPGEAVYERHRAEAPAPDRYRDEAPARDPYTDFPAPDGYPARPPVSSAPADYAAVHAPAADYPGRFSGDLAAGQEEFPERAPADWTPAHADGPPPAWTPPEKSDTAAAAPKSKRLALIGGIVAVAVASAGLTAGIMAAVGGGSAATTGPGGGQGIGQGGPGGNQGVATATTNALHGTYVVSDGNGGYTTQLTQTGTVSAISSSSVTVKSDDGYSKTYVISTSTTVGSGRIADVLKGHTVRIVATSAKQKITATSITDSSLASAGGPQN
ncbi:hypothetical protein [Actinoplanes sp. NPDC026619]|uniref:hypothetical protein n=1 Tax=Actinoplanes sp. NPDC026619 TaxID=3155798 RepID=UPI0033E91E31